MGLRGIEGDEKHSTEEWHKLTPLKCDISNNLSVFCPTMIIALVMILTISVKFSSGWERSQN
jgi:hypothetical protein